MRYTSDMSIKFITYNDLSPTSTITNCVFSGAVSKPLSINGSAATKESKYIEIHHSSSSILIINIFYKFSGFLYYELKYHILSDGSF